MAFSNLRIGSILYILKKDEHPALEQAKVTNITPPVPKIGSYDLTIDIATKDANFQKVPCSSEIADLGGNQVIASSKEAIKLEVENLMQMSEQILNSVDYHKNRFDGFKKILSDLNPESKETQELRNEIGQLKSMFAEFLKSYGEKGKQS